MPNKTCSFQFTSPAMKVSEPVLGVKQTSQFFSHLMTKEIIYFT